MALSKRHLLCAVASAPLVLTSLSVTANAGPVQRRLESLGGNVPVPGVRPAETQTGTSQDADTDTDDKASDKTSDDEAADEGEKVDAGPVDAPPVIPPVKPPETDVPEIAPPLPEEPANAPSLSQTTCIEELRKIADIQVSDQPLDADAACIVHEPVILNATKGDYAVTFTEGLLLSCPFALRLARFTADTVQPLARHHIGAELTELGSGQGFVCRRRNSASSNKWSEHSYGKAIDIVRFSFAGKDPLSVRSTDGMSENRAAFLNATRSAACGTFTTVLGPGSNEAHATHFHFDTGRMSGKKKNPYRICE